ncbi:Putative CDP-alcohol phosphatidyltransferase [Septoria linicola]|uniref:CDP-alcohol phosphatidyltransferase n=1 Tax=Septoria linicola TaxID=215465 RepID=A0A9Q9EHD1_9PEZI|nr:putative CDP-alcohol phosphatidyltransferase [Septoria linicola]USW49874.1 Putative CDP-alcohol phosphatidyltransferase [Septoria linicola]
MVQDVVDEKELAQANGNGHVNGSLQNGHAKGPETQVEEEEEEEEEEATNENIFLFIPNLIGYARIVLAIASLQFMPLHPRRCSFLYSISCLLDAADGVAARKYEQSTRFGAVLDMVTDRCTTTCLLVFLATAKPAYSVIFQLLISLDLASHYMHMYATLVMGGQTQSHKNVDASRSKLMHLYYTNKTVLFIVCALNELCFIGLYLLCFSSPFLTPALRTPTETTPTSPLEPQPTLLFWRDPFSPAAMEYARANKMDSNIPWVIFVASAPVMLFKQWVNIVQLVQASRWLAEGDRKDRKKLGLPRGKKGVQAAKKEL